MAYLKKKTIVNPKLVFQMNKYLACCHIRNLHRSNILNDTYVVDSTTDTITEAAGAGTDSVNSSVAYTLGNNLENLTLTGSTGLAGTGNALNNSITGTSGNDTLNGGAGAKKRLQTRCRALCWDATGHDSPELQSAHIG